MSILEVSEIYHTFGDRVLFSGASMQLSSGDKMGLTGLNGVGKSTFINFLTGETLPDKGFVRFNPKTKVGFLDQQAHIVQDVSVREYLRLAFSELYDVEARMNGLLSAIEVEKDPVEQEKLAAQASSCQDQLLQADFYAIPSLIDKVAAGLGLTAIGLDKPVSILSGGQRAKVTLSRLILDSPDVLILDEPTNFIDREHIDWLGKFLSGFKGSFIIVSHDEDFLRRVVNCVCDIEFGVMTRYNGSYDHFIKLKAEKRENYEKNYNAQQKQISKLEDYVERNIARASTTKMARSRQKQLEKIERLQKPTETAKPTFSFAYSPLVAKTLMYVNDLEVGYDNVPLLPKINLMMQNGQKLAVTGFNGIGKTTFLKTICGLLEPVSGTYKYANNLKIGYYRQDTEWDGSKLTPQEIIREKYPKILQKDILNALARAGLNREKSLQAVSTLSGGEQAKVKIALMTLEAYNLLVLDEPTSHLDVKAIERLSEAITRFEGGVIFVSHSKAFVEQNADSVFDFEALFD